MSDIDFKGLTRILALYGVKDPEKVAGGIADSEWLLRHEFRTVRSFLTGCMKGLEEVD